MSQLLLKNNVTFCNRITRGAGFFFGSTRHANARLSKWRFDNKKQPGDVPSTYAEFRDALGIKNDKAWLEFMVAFVNSFSVVRRRSANFGWHTASIPSQLDTDSMRQSEQQTKSSSSSQSDSFDSDDSDDSDSGPSSSPAMQQRVAEMEAQFDNLKTQLENERINAIIALDKLKKQQQAEQVTRMVIENREKGTTKDLGMVHKQMGSLILRMKARRNTYLVGPAGSGKTTAAEMAAAALGLQFGFMSVGAQTTKTDILGYMSATGTYVITEFRKRFEHGGVFLFDELDAGNGGVLTCINAALAGKSCAFPDAIIAKHPELRCVAAGNTYGNGPDRVYVGRLELDGASLDRFNFLDWQYDEALEFAIAKQVNEPVALRWVPFVQAARKAVLSLGLRHIVSPRASIGGTELLLAGEGWTGEAGVEETDLWKALKPADVSRVKAEMARAGFSYKPMTKEEVQAVAA